MTEDEKNYLYFKVHDLDGNDKLDGLEIFYSATHHSLSDQSHNHKHEHEHELIENSENGASGDLAETHETDQNQLSNDNTSNSDSSNLKLLELDEDGEIVNENLIHIIGM